MPDGTLLDAALAAGAAGLSVVPARMDGTKRPEGEWRRWAVERAPEAQLRRWFANGRTGMGVVCGAVSGNLEMLEIDHPATGLTLKETWAEFLDRCRYVGLDIDAILDGYAEVTPGGGLHLLYRCTEAVEGNLKLARRPATPDEMVDDPNPVRVIFETRGEGGFVVVAPSHGTTHPSGKPWRAKRGSFATIATIDAEQRAVLLEVARSFDELGGIVEIAGGGELPGGDSVRSGGGTVQLRDLRSPPPANPSSWMDATVAAFNQATSWAQILESHGWADAGTNGGIGHWTRPGKAVREGHSATTNANGTDRFILWSSSVALPGIDTATGARAPSYDRFSMWAALEHGGDRLRAAEAARKAGFGPEWRDGSGVDLDALLGRRGGSGVAMAERLERTDGTHLPEHFWTARPGLAHIRQAARSRLVAPDAVLGAILARVAAITPHTVELDSGIGSATGLSFFAGLVGPPEAGKTAAAFVAADLLPAPDRVLDLLPIGSGEGMVEILFDMVDEEQEGKKAPVKVKRQVRHALIFHVDEGAVLGELANRSGSALLPTMRTAWSHGTLGNVNASAEKRRVVDGRSYVYGITLGIQPELAGPLLLDTAAGTPQRFVWLMATDPDAGEALEWPGELPWCSPDAGDLDRHGHVTRRGWRRHPLGLTDAIRAHVRMDRVAVQRGDLQRASADAHRILVRLKIAALLAILDGRLDVQGEDWDLAEIVDDTSRRIRHTLEAGLLAVEERKVEARLGYRAREAEAVEAARSGVPARVARIAVKIATYVHDRAPEGATYSQLRNRLVSHERHLIDAVLAHAASNSWLTESAETVWKPGESRPV